MKYVTPASQPTLRLRRSQDRGFEDFGWTDNWLTFSFGGYRSHEWNNFGPLRVVVENHIQPHSGFPSHSHRDAEIITYVSAGTLTHRDSFGNTAAVSAGGVQVISAGSRGMVHSEQNLHDVVEHNLQIWIIPDRAPTEFSYADLSFTREERQGRFRLYVSPDGRDQSVRINADVHISAGLFSRGDHYHHPLASGRGAWIQVVHGGVDLTIPGAAPVTLAAGDGIGITDLANTADGTGAAIGFTFHDSSEVVLFDVNMKSRLLWQ